MSEAGWPVRAEPDAEGLLAGAVGLALLAMLDTLSPAGQAAPAAGCGAQPSPADLARQRALADAFPAAARRAD